MYATEDSHRRLDRPFGPAVHLARWNPARLERLVGLVLWAFLFAVICTVGALS